MEFSGSPAIITNDAVLLEAALRWCAATGASADVAHDVPTARGLWRRASVVLVGDDLVPELAAAGLVRRDRVAVVAGAGGPAWPQAVALGVDAAFLVPDQEEQVLDWLGSGLDGVGEACVVSVVGGSGGVGASTLAASLCLHAARRGAGPMLIDFDPEGGGAELLLGSSLSHGLNWSQLADTTGRITSSILTDVVPSARGIAALSWSASDQPKAPNSLVPVLSSAERAFDLVVVDLPRRGAPCAHEAVGRSALTVVVVAEEVRALAAARHTVSMLRQTSSTIGLVAMQRAGGTGAAVVAEVLEAPVLARVRRDRRVRQAVDAGAGPGGSRTLRRASGAILDVVGIT